MNLESKGKYKFNWFRKELSQESFTDFFDYYFTRLTQFSITIVKSELLAEEIVLDVFLKLWEQRTTLDTIINIETYLFISVRNKSINTLIIDIYQLYVYQIVNFLFRKSTY